MKEKYSRRHKFNLGTECSVENCNNEADFEVLLYDDYAQQGYEFLEQDYTCPFLCEKHKNENKEKAFKVEPSRCTYEYPYSNRNGAQGITKYVPIKEAYPEMFNK